MKPNSKTYTLYGLTETGKEEIKYVGATTLPLSVRLSIHRTLARKETNKKSIWIKNQNYEVDIVLIETNISKDDATERERYYINLWKDQLMNTQPGGVGTTEEKKKKINEATKKTKGELRRPVYQYTFCGELVAQYASAKTASTQTGFNQGGISSSALGRCYSFKGFVWSYEKKKVQE